MARCLYWDIRATCYVTASAAAVAFLLGRPPRAGFMSGSFSARNPENLAAFSFRTICPQEGRRGAREVGRGLETRAAGRLRAGGASASAPAAKPRLRQAHHGVKAAENLRLIFRGLRMCVRKNFGSVGFIALSRSSFLRIQNFYVYANCAPAMQGSAEEAPGKRFGTGGGSIQWVVEQLQPLRTE